MVKLKLEKNPKRPKYLLLSDGIIEQIDQGKLIMDQKLPSVNKLAEEFNFSRETVFKALFHLSERGIVKAVDKIGYFVNDTSPQTNFRVFFMLDKFTSFKEDLFHSLCNALGDQAKVSMYFHHQNMEVLQSLILQNLKNYTHFVITTYLDEDDILYEVLDKIPPEKLIIIDKYESQLSKGYGMVYQDFENDLFNALSTNVELVKKYAKLILINHENAPHGNTMKSGFKRFCKKYRFKGEVHNNLLMKNFVEGNLYITMDAYDRDMVEIIKMTRLKEWELGKQIGLISYNDTPAKEILDGGITVISTDFKKMGKEAAHMILSGKRLHKPNETKVILRNSL